MSSPNRLTGLLSFMLSDEMTTGSVTTSDAEKRVYAARSHAWNLEQRRFKEAFPDVSLHNSIQRQVSHLSLVLFELYLGRDRDLDSCL